MTNFNITRYNVEKIMACDTLLAGDLARRDREIGFCSRPSNHNSPMVEGLGDIFLHHRNIHDEPSQETEKQQLHIGYHMAQSSSDATVDNNELAGNLECSAAEDPGKIGMQFSNSSSMDTSLSVSQEGSPERNVVPMSSGKVSPSNGLSTMQRNPSPLIHDIDMPHLPVFASWTDL